MKYLLLLLLCCTSCVITSKIAVSEKAYVAKCFAKAREIKYVADKEGEYWQTPSETEKLKTGDCEDQSFYLHYLLSLKDIQSKVVVGLTSTDNARKELEKEGATLHAWNEVVIDGEPYVLDVTSNTFRKKSNLVHWYKWDITQDRGVLNEYKYSIISFCYRLEQEGYKDLAKEIRIGFTIDEQ